MKRSMNLRALSLVAAFALVPVLAACGGDSDDGNTTTGAAAGTTTEAASASSDLTALPPEGCGAVDLKAPEDPDNVLASLTDEHREHIASYNQPIRASSWSDWKPKGEGPYTVGVQWSALNTDFQVEQTEALRKHLNDSDLVDKVIFQSTKDSIDVPAQIQGFEALLRQKPDLIIIQPIAGTAFNAQVKKAKDAGIPVVVAIQHIDSPDVVNVQPNATLAAIRGASALARLMDAKGNLLVLHAVPGSAAEVDGMVGLEAVLEGCPDIKVSGNVTGNFVAALAKAETLKFLASNPGKLDGVFDINSMAAGAMDAIDQSGRPMPAVFLRSVSRAGLGYWDQNRDSFKGFGTVISSKGLGETTGTVATKMLAGDGIKVNSLVRDSTYVTSENLDEWVEPGWNLTTAGTIPGPDEWMPVEFIDGAFNNGAGEQ